MHIGYGIKWIAMTKGATMLQPCPLPTFPPGSGVTSFKVGVSSCVPQWRGECKTAAVIGMSYARMTGQAMKKLMGIMQLQPMSFRTAREKVIATNDHPL
eukprot:scaffold276213_cov17-Tisochrysis_lutea.AAC.1